MDYGFAVTDAGRYLIARLLTGEVLHITKVMVGEGRVPDGVRLAAVEDLYQPIAQATSDTPRCDGGVAYLTVEYNNTLGGGLETGFWLREIGIYALDPAAGEILFAYATLGDIPQYVTAYDPARGVNVHRFPFSFAVGEDRGMAVDFHSGLWMTAEDVQQYYMTVLAPQIDEQIADAIGNHDRDAAAHGGFARIMNTEINPRLAMAELMEELALTTGSHAGHAKTGTITFADMTGIDVSGNLNIPLARIEF